MNRHLIRSTLAAVVLTGASVAVVSPASAQTISRHSLSIRPQLITQCHAAVSDVSIYQGPYPNGQPVQVTAVQSCTGSGIVQELICYPEKLSLGMFWFQDGNSVEKDITTPGTLSITHTWNISDHGTFRIFCSNNASDGQNTYTDYTTSNDFNV